MLIFVLTTSVFANQITLNINDQDVWTPVSPVIEAGTTLVPLRIIGENLGATLDWDGFTKMVTITKGSTQIKLVINSKSVQVNNVKKQLLAPPKLIKGTTMVPLRFISENLNSEVDWDSRSRTVFVRDQVAIHRYHTTKHYANPEEGILYKGQVTLKNGIEVPDGEGELLVKNGDIFAGLFRNGEIVLGKVIHTNDEIYEGQFRNGKAHGNGIYFYDNGTYYEGEFKNGMFNGYGRITFDNGEFYEGYFENDQYMWE